MKALVLFQCILGIFIGNCFSIKVLDTANNLDISRGPQSGIRFKRDYNIQLNKTTVCFRFFNYRILSLQYLFKLGPFSIGTSYSKDNTLYSYGSSVYYWPENDDIVTTVYLMIEDKNSGFKIISYELPEWPSINWNSFCFTLSMTSRNFAIFLNGKKLLSEEFIGVTLISENLELNDITIMAKGYKQKSQFKYSLLGRITDIYVFNKVLTLK